jgi:hypothetical protein
MGTTRSLQNVPLRSPRQIACLLLDCVIIVVSLLLGMISLKTSQELNEMLDTD